MTPSNDHRDLWEGLVSFAFDDPDAEMPFTARLARDNGWTAAFAALAVEEYRRFLFLTQAAGHDVVPPYAVEQAWHLHLVYTLSYWDDLCGDLLGQPLHHSPAWSGPENAERRRHEYGATFQSYHDAFGVPPADIWPDLDAWQASEVCYVDPAKYWLVPKPVVAAKRDRVPHPHVS